MLPRRTILIRLLCGDFSLNPYFTDPHRSKKRSPLILSRVNVVAIQCCQLVRSNVVVRFGQGSPLLPKHKEEVPFLLKNQFGISSIWLRMVALTRKFFKVTSVYIYIYNDIFMFINFFFIDPNI